jgi:hypothetical protein
MEFVQEVCRHTVDIHPILDSFFDLQYQHKPMVMILG